MSFILNPNMPDFEARDAEKVFKIGILSALLVVRPPSFAEKIDPDIDKDILINHLYAMVVFKNSELQIIITSETTSTKIISLASDEVKKELLKPSLCIYDDSGSIDNLGKSKDYSNIDTFCNKCFELIKERLGEKSKPIQLNNTFYLKDKFKVKNAIKKWHFGKIIFLSIMYLIILLLAKIIDRYNDLLCFAFIIFTPIISSIIWIWLSGNEKH